MMEKDVASIDSILQDLPAGWFVSTAEIAQDLERELKIELPEGHRLHGHQVRIVAHRNGTDDILCWHVNEPVRFTVVHLTWSGIKQSEPDYPWIECDGTFGDFLDFENKNLGRYSKMPNAGQPQCLPSAHQPSG